MSELSDVGMINQSVPPEEEAEWKLPSFRKVGVILLILTETALFTIFVVAYLFYIKKSLNGPYPQDVLELPILATAALLSSSITVVIAERAFMKNARGTFHLWWGLTMVLGLFFLGFTAHEWYTLIYRDGLTIATNVFGSTFYALVGLHASHVIIGLILLGLVFVLSLLGHVKPDQAERIEMISWYWHFVDVVWIVVFIVVYIISRSA